MKYPNFREEKKLWKKGCKFVIGLDEAGRGPLAGPVIAAAAAVKNPKFPKRFGHWTLGFGISEVRDSKKMSIKQREKVYKKLIKCENIIWGIGIVSEKVIDKINILQATKLAMQRAVDASNSKVSFPRKRESRHKSRGFWIPNQVGNDRSKIDYLLIDGNFKIKSEIPQKSIIKADEKVFSCAAASIIAKVTRDRLMKKYHKKYPEYGFDRHKGYPTKAHFANLEKFGPCKIHRRSFWPVSANLKFKIRNLKSI